MKSLILATVLSLGFAAPALAGGDWLPPVKDPLTLKECGSCHMAFQPGFLSAAAWQKMMGNLADHYGDNAEMAPEKVRAITQYLTANAGGYRRGVSDSKITDTAWFARKHRKVAPEVWTRKEVMSKSNCSACHKQAEQGNYDDDD